jgi:hypothetical protein
MRTLRLVWLDVKVLAVLAALILLVLMSGGPSARPLSDEAAASFVRDTAREWRSRYGAAPGLRVAVIDVRFSGEAEHFQEGEGFVSVPVALDLPGGQQVVEVAARPACLRRIDVEGTATVAWEYPGRYHRDLRYLALALVRSTIGAPPELPSTIAFDRLPPDLRDEALLDAGQLEEHGLDRCDDFPQWARQNAGAPPHTDQLLRLARVIAARVKADEQPPRWDEDVCSGMREGTLTLHRAQVLLVMAARHVGVPAFAFSVARIERRYLVGTFVDECGWVLVDVEHARRGWVRAGGVLLTKTPLLGGFDASRHALWHANAAAFAPAGGVLQEIADTTWGEGPRSTTARTLSLEEACR